MDFVNGPNFEKVNRIFTLFFKIEPTNACSAYYPQKGVIKNCNSKYKSFLLKPIKSFKNISSKQMSGQGINANSKQEKRIEGNTIISLFENQDRAARARMYFVLKEVNKNYNRFSKKYCELFARI